ncbi:hypothetical protein BX661DRAFT_178479 [Kickxella alabastrina]|uniref:uncharacterized protein n=1 Tax=Kickxella alabastrina TaxID=61397 RepID=UPI002220B69C|nr:uncharacterized protein BX661DRAFT_178479 [Kickxella alabastrina]KAI7833487.1 hypothetical protein BX661DRAFT_178479 [Kickxella alabastrina]
MNDPGQAGAHQPNTIKSSVFVPQNWNFQNNTNGLINLIQGVVRAIDRNLAPERPPHSMQAKSGMHSMATHGSHGQHNGHGGHNNGRGGHNNGHGSHYGHGNRFEDGGQMNQSFRAHGQGQMNQSSHGHGHSHSHSQGHNPQRVSNMSRVSIIDDRASIFSRRWDALPQGSRAVIGENSVLTNCPRCRDRVMTVVRRQIGGKNVAATAVMSIVGILVNAPAALLPLALTVLELNSLKRKVHYCPNCNYKMGKHVTISIPSGQLTDKHSSF